MRQAIETAPMDGTFVILEDDASGTQNVAHWSSKAGEWVGKDGESIKITPTHWYPAPSAGDGVVASRSVVTVAPVTLDAFQQQSAPVEANSPPHARRFAASSITATLDRYAGRYGIFGISMMGIFGISMMGILGIIMMGGQVAEQASRSPSDLETLQQRTESEQTAAQAHAQVKQPVEATASRAKELQQERQRAAGAASEERVADNAVSELRRERERAEALARELARVRREVETAAAVSSRKDDEAVKLKLNAETAVTELRQSLQQEQKKTAALMQEAKAAQAMTTGAEQQRRALEEAQARAAALASELAGTQPRDRDPGRAVAKGSRCGHQTEAGGGEHHRGTATIPAAGAKEDCRPDAGSQGRASDDDGCRATAPRPRRGTGACRSPRERACGNTAARSRPRPRSRKRQSMRPRKQKQAAESTIAELRQSLQQEQKKTAALMQEAKAAQAMTTAAEPQRRALEEAQARAAALASELAGTQPRDRDPGRAVAKGSRCGHETEAGGGEHHRGTATIPGAGAKEDRRPDAGSQGRASDDDGCRATAPRPRRGTGPCRSPRERACGEKPRDRDPGRAVAKGRRCGHETEAGGGEHHRGTATIPGAGAKEDRRPDAGSQGRTSDDDGCRATAPRPRRGTGPCRGPRERACGETAARSRPRPRSRKRQSMRPRNRSRRRRAPSRNCDNPCSRSKRRLPP